MKVVSVFTRRDRNHDPEQAAFLDLELGLGIVGDCHADQSSPRQVLLVSTEAYEKCGLKSTSLRENILLDAPNLCLTSGSLLVFPSGAALRITFECEPCGRLNRFKPKLSKEIRGLRGYLARVVYNGRVEPNDEIEVTAGVFAPFSDRWQDRIIQVAKMLPVRRKITFGELAKLAGVPKAFCRAFPRVLRSQPNSIWQRVVPSNHLSGGGLEGLYRIIFDGEPLP